MTTSPADIVNQCLDAIGCDKQVGDLEEGGAVAAAALRHYMPTLRHVSRAAKWNCLRKQASMLLLQDATGWTTQQQQQAGGPVTVGTGTVGMRPWIYEYQLPIDCVQARFVPASLTGPNGIPPGNITPPNPGVPQTTGAGVPLVYVRQIPVRFVVTNDNNPNLVGAITDWSQLPDYATVAGQGPTSSTVILCNQPNSTLVYTALITACDQWDYSFRLAFVSVLATFLAMPCLKDKKQARLMRDDQVKIAKRMLDEARVRDGDEGAFDTDHIPDWLRVRSRGGWGSEWGGFGSQAFGGGFGGVLGYGWGTCGLGDGSAY
jgi:hypothetical protein